MPPRRDLTCTRRGLGWCAMSKVALVQPIGEPGVRMLREAGHDVVAFDNPLSASQLKDTLKSTPDVEGMIVKNAAINREVIESAPRLKVIARHGVGLDRIDLTAAAENGVVVTHTPEANCISVAEHALALILALSRNLITWDRAVRDSDFEVRKRLPGRELSGKTLGILGMGKSGRSLAQMALHGLRMRVVAYTPHPDPAKCPGVKLIPDWREVLGIADYVSLHMPLTPETEGLIGRTELELMQPGAFLINCSRGQIVKEKELIEILMAGRIGGAGLDVFEEEPPQEGNPLLQMENVILTPHGAAHTHEALERMAEQAARSVIDVLNGLPPTWPAPLPPPAP
ncbi:hydroxyacid dehydrogenase [Oceanidesulfovibrio marinus]|uniref:Hydroxyacid dehydrogenase n=2 Tax=Oceanidesulfovibrio marinus TaxID=370038 RepID=A0ABX6NE18_9BACT|nr:hydroxyacid dehydrogenase [Oceanidesulfovibrio marinus]